MKKLMIIILFLSSCKQYSKVEISNNKYSELMSIYVNRDNTVIATSIKGIVHNYIINEDSVFQSTTDTKGNLTKELAVSIEIHKEKYKHIEEIFHSYVGDVISHNNLKYTILDKTVYNTNDVKIELLQYDESGKSSILFFEYEVLSQ